MDGYFRLVRPLLHCPRRRQLTFLVVQAPDTWLDPSSLLPVGSNKAADKETFAAGPDGPSAAKQVDA